MNLKITCFYLIIAAQILFSASCSFLSSDQTVNAELLGEWEWERTYGGFAGLTIYSDSTDYSQSVYFDNHDNVFWFRNDQLMKKYVVETGKEEWNDGKLIMREVDQDEGSGFHNIKFITLSESGSLILMDQCYDCYSHFFQRKK